MKPNVVLQSGPVSIENGLHSGDSSLLLTENMNRDAFMFHLLLLLTACSAAEKRCLGVARNVCALKNRTYPTDARWSVVPFWFYRGHASVTSGERDRQGDTNLGGMASGFLGCFRYTVTQCLAPVTTNGEENARQLG